MDYWIRATDGQTYGPASLATMNRWITERRVIASTPVSHSPDGPWREATMVPELAAGFGIEPADTADPSEKAEANDPTEPMLNADPTEPMLSTDPTEPMLRIDPSDA